MGKCKNAPKESRGTQKGTSSTPLFHEGEPGDTGNSLHNLGEDMASFEEVLLWMGASSKTPFRFTQSS